MPIALSRQWKLLVALLAGAALRMLFVHYWPQVDGDSLIYGEIAKNWLLHGTYALGHGDIAPTLIRLPGYPLFLAACFSIFGMEHYNAILYLQVAADLVTCLLIAGFVRLIRGPRAAFLALVLAALCPFTANYTSSPLTETLSIFCIALAMYALALLLHKPGLLPLALLTFAFSYAALLRPDGALLAVAFCPAIVIYGMHPPQLAPGISSAPALRFPRALRQAFLCGLISILPFIPWTLRNWNTFHVFQPVAPRYANDPGESSTPGAQRWVKTWCVDFASTFDFYWNLDSDLLDFESLPARAYDGTSSNGTSQRDETEALLEEYNQHTTVTPELDARFGALADARIREHPIRYYVGLPLARLVNMWLRPRVEALPIELHWWQYSEHPAETVFAWCYGALNLAYLIAAFVGWVKRPPLAGVLLAYMLLRSLLLATIEAPETRYTLECFPMIIALAAVALDRSRSAAPGKLSA